MGKFIFLIEEVVFGDDQQGILFIENFYVFLYGFQQVDWVIEYFFVQVDDLLDLLFGGFIIVQFNDCFDYRKYKVFDFVIK